MRTILFFCVTLIGITQIKGQVNLETIRAKWKQKRYDDVITVGIQFRETLQGKAIPALDYMILSSICMTFTPRSEPCSEVQDLLKDYYNGLPKNDYALMQNGFDRICNQKADPDFALSDKLPSRQYAHIQRSSSITSRFKTYMLMSEGLKKSGVFNRIDYDEIRNIVEALIDKKDSVRSLNDKLIENYVQRRLRKGDSANIKKAVNRFGPNSKYWASENFLVITSKINKINPKQVALNMEDVLKFYKRAYNMSNLSEYIVIYLVKDYREVRPYIQKLYFNKISFNPLGFSNFYDNSMVAWIYDGSMVGTLKHELIHLLIRSSFSFIPDWFEEGLASLYEESRFDTSLNLYGKNNWRGVLLKETQLHYSLSDLFANRDVNFDSYELRELREEYKEEIRRASLRDENLRWLYKDHNQELDEVLTAFLTNRVALYKDALSKYFLFYLQDGRKLNQMYQALLQRDKSAMDIVHYKRLQSVILEVCGKSSMVDLQKDFDDWLNRLPRSM